jgi:nucleoside phosphorylase
MARRLSRNEYTIGWLCALSDELTAAMMMLDEKHQDPIMSLNETNVYTLGSIGGHNVVITSLPAGRLGTSSATVVATQMKLAFPAIRFGLMVGIAGGVPGNNADIRLGDVVVSQPVNGHSGVVQYDFGKYTASGFQRTGSLNPPPSILLAAASKLRSYHDQGRSGIPTHLSRFNHMPKFQRDTAGSDVLFEATYIHGNDNSCVSCTPYRNVKRRDRVNNWPVVHYGTIASGNRVMRSASLRDKLSSELEGALCFEMEAAGLMNYFSCLVIRGVCDYSDSHKNKKWQPYAAATAAAYAKDLLLIIPVAEVMKLPALSTLRRG